MIYPGVRELDKQQIKQFGKRAIQNGYLSADEFKQHTKKFLKLKKRGGADSFPEFLSSQEILTDSQINELQLGTESKPEENLREADDEPVKTSSSVAESSTPAGDDRHASGQTAADTAEPGTDTATDQSESDGPERPLRERSEHTTSIQGGRRDTDDGDQPGSPRDRLDRSSSSSSSSSVMILIGAAVLLAAGAAGGYFFVTGESGDSGNGTAKETATAEGQTTADKKGSPAASSRSADDTGEAKESSNTEPGTARPAEPDDSTNKTSSSSSTSDTPDSSEETSDQVASAGGDDSGKRTVGTSENPGNQGSTGANVSAPDAEEGGSGKSKLKKWVHRPTPAPELPDEFDTFDPPAPTVDSEKLGVSKWTKTADPGEIAVIAGHGFDTGGGVSFTLYGHSNGTSFQKQVKPFALEPHKASVRLPEQLPDTSVYLAYPTNENGRGTPALINRTEVWYALPKNPNPGETVAVYGRNLSHRMGEEKSWVYLKPKGKDVIGTWAEVTNVNPYEVEFTIPEDFEKGTYEVWVHNGHGRQYGWHPLHSKAGDHVANDHLHVRPERTWDGPRIDVTDLGANPNDTSPDDEAIQKALKKANNNKDTTIYFPEGTYITTKTMKPVRGPDDSGMRIIGDGKDKTHIIGHHKKSPNPFIHIKGNNVVLKDLHMDIQRDVEGKKELNTTNKYGRIERVLLQTDKWRDGLDVIRCRLDAQEQRAFWMRKRDQIHLYKSEFIGTEEQLHTASFVRIDQCDFIGTRDAGTMMYSHGGWCVSVTDCRGLNADPDLTAVGRFFTVSAGWQRTENVYIGGNRTKNLLPREGPGFIQNMGEQVMWEGVGAVDQQQPVSVKPNFFTFPENPGADKKGWYYTALVTAGKGLGQTRQIGGDGNAPKNWQVIKEWDVLPNENSTISMSISINRLVVYDNYFDGRPRAVNSEEHIASSGVQPWGSSNDVVIDSNTFHEIREGINLASFKADRRAPTPTFFHLIQDNTFDTVRWGVGGGASVGNKQKADLPGPSTVGVIFRDNTFKNVKKKAVKWNIKGREGVRVFDMIYFHGNRITNVPYGFKFFKNPAPASSYGHLGLFDNHLKRGSAEKSGSVGIHLFTKERLLRENNTVEGFEKNWKFGK